MKTKNDFDHLIPDWVPENKRKNPFVVMYFKKEHMMKHMANGGRMEDLIDEGYKFVAPEK